MSHSGTIIIPELQNYYTKFIINSQLNKSGILYSVQINDLFINGNSFIRMLFDNTWPDTNNSYRYLYRDDNNVGSWPSIIRDRAMIHPSSSKYYVSDSEDISICNVNIFNLSNNDLTMLDALLKYRNTDSTSLIVIDSTSVIDPVFIEDSTSTLTVNFVNLSNLSKLIFLYLNLKINQDISYYNNLTLISANNSVLESAYECYVIEQMFLYVDGKNIFE